jgi:phosphoglycolate phosphatase
MATVDLIIFDLDGTLIDTSTDIAVSVNHALTMSGITEIDKQTIINYVGNGARNLFVNMLPGKTAAEIDALLRDYSVYYDNHLRDNTRLYPGVAETIDHYKTKKKAVISNKSESFSKRILDGLKILDKFDLVLGAESVKKMKPDPLPVLTVMQMLNVPKEKTVMIGDGVNDIKAGLAAGVHTCAVTYGFSNKNRIIELNPEHIVDKIQDIFTIIN